MSEEKLSFQAEVSRLLDIVAHSLYSNKEIFLRELISNASDACDRLRYAALTAGDLMGSDPEFRIRIAVDGKTKTLTVSDNGIGMNRGDLVENLGTIARSGTAAFISELDNKKDGAGLIGQFGVGFYSAFMVADRVEVTTRKAGDAEAWRWASDGKGEFTISEADDGPERGTRISLTLKKEEKEFLDPARIRAVIKTYSDHIAIPILLETPEESAEQEKPVNTASALWTRPKSEISDEQYKEFYHHTGHAFDEPWLRLHFKAEGVIEYTGLLFIPETKPFDLYHPDRKQQVKLYVKRVFITDDCAEPEDLPLNISRELLQHNPTLAKIRKAVTKRVLGELKKQADKKPEGYVAFWENFGPVLKEGIYEDGDQRDALLALARFTSTKADGPTSLSDYIGRMKEGQEAIYYISGENAEALAKSPQLEGFAAKGVEVLLLTDPVDEFWVGMVPEYQDKPFKSATRGGADLSKIDGETKEAAAEKPAAEPDVAALIAFIKLTLKDEVKDVRASERLTNSAVCLVADEGDIDMHLERILMQHRQLEQAAQRILEINPKHPLIKNLCARIGESGAGEEVEEVARLLLDQARIMEGEVLPDPSAFAASWTKV
jgi:molecular chaperone HtpG